MRRACFYFGVGLVSAATVGVATDMVELTPRECVQRLETVSGDVERFRAILTNEPGRGECVQEIAAKLRVLMDLGRQSAEALERLGPAKDDEAIEAEKEKLLAMVARADQLAEAARNCTGTTTAGRPPKRKPQTTPIINTPLVPAMKIPVLPVVPRPSWPVRTAAEGIRQSEAAGMLAQMLGVATEKAVAVLGGRQIEPLGGWQPAESLTVDDFCVAVARALALKVEEAEEPASYAQALRDAGLPVDQFLPPRTVGVPVYLLAREVRAFLAAGRMAPLQRAFAPATH